MFVALDKPSPAVWAHHRAPYLRIVLAAIACHVLLFVLTPPFTFEPYRMEVEEDLIFENVPDVEIPESPKEIPRPEVDPTVYDGPDAVDEVLPPTSPDDFGDFINPPLPDRQANGGFVPYDQPPVPVLLVTPSYPELAREAGIEGTVRVEVVIDTEGKVVDAAVVESDVTPSMERAALDAAKRCTFEPAKQRSKPVKVMVVIPFEFRLTE
jgi:protein TonB